MTADHQFRFKWRKRAHWNFEAYDAFVDDIPVAQVLLDRELMNHPQPYTWQVVALYIPPPFKNPTGRALTPRDGAIAAEAAFWEWLPRAHKFWPPLRVAVRLAEVLAVELPPGNAKDLAEEKARREAACYDERDQET